MKAKALRFRNLLFAAVALILIFLSVELCALGAYYFLTEEAFSLSAVGAERTEILTAGDAEGAASPAGLKSARLRDAIQKYAVDEIPHPFLGYIKRSKRLDSWDARIIRRRQSEDEAVVLLFGGSVAGRLWNDAREQLVEELRKISEFEGRTITVLKAAVSGFKQPQQMLGLAYALSLGGEYDIVVNLDGLNEIVLPQTNTLDNPPVSPFYPRRWARRVQVRLDPIEQSMVGLVATLRLQRRELAEWGASFPFRYSPAANFIWKFLDRGLESRIAENRLELTEYVAEEVDFNRYVSTGAAPKIDDDELLVELSRVWAQASIQMHRIGEANRVRYFHFLQPSQYVENSKPFSAEEMECCFEHPSYGDRARKGYPHLIGQGEHLLESGVHFVDLTDLFSGTKKTVYVDRVGHVNLLGNRMLAQAIGGAIRKAWQTNPLRTKRNGESEVEP